MKHDELLAEFNPEKGSPLHNVLAPLAAADLQYQDIIEREGELTSELAAVSRGAVVLDWSSDVNSLPLDKIQTDQARAAALQQLLKLSKAEREKRFAAWQAAKVNAGRIVSDFRAQQRVIRDADKTIATAEFELTRIKNGAHRSPQSAETRIYQAKAQRDQAQAAIDRLNLQYCKA